MRAYRSARRIGRVQRFFDNLSPVDEATKSWSVLWLALLVGWPPLWLHTVAILFMLEVTAVAFSLLSVGVDFAYNRDGSTPSLTVSWAHVVLRVGKLLAFVSVFVQQQLGRGGGTTTLYAFLLCLVFVLHIVAWVKDLAAKIEKIMKAD